MQQATAHPISIRKMAAALDVSKSQVARDAQAGMPMHDMAAARAWRLEHHDISRTKEGRIDRPASPTPAPTSPPRPARGITNWPGAAEPEESDLPAGAGDSVDTADEDTSDEHTAAYREHRANRERVNAERGQLELDQLRGRLIDVDESKRLGFTAFRMLRDAVLNVPARIKDQVAIETDAFKVEQLIEAEIVAALSTFDPARLIRDAEDDEAD